MDRRAELAHLRIAPTDVGLPDFGRRRTPGLRREEVAGIAGVSLDYYVRMEQRVRPGLLRLLDVLDPTPALVMGRLMDVLAWNRAAAALLTDFAAVPVGQRNMVRLAFLDRTTRSRYGDWPAVAHECVAYLRMVAGRAPEDPALAALVGELTVKSAEFAELWARHDVRSKTTGRREFVHPVAGRFTLDYDVHSVAGTDEQRLVAYTAAPGSVGQSALDLLAVVGPAPHLPEGAARDDAVPPDDGSART